MRVKTVEDFTRELEDMRARLVATGREVSVGDNASIGGIRCDFELPYSSMPSTSKHQWEVRSIRKSF